jgi:hypothetical protein
MVMSIYSRTSALPALRPVGQPARTRVVQPAVHRDPPVDHAPEKGDERRRNERGATDHVTHELRLSAQR